MNKIDSIITNNLKIENKNNKTVNPEASVLLYYLFKNNLIYNPKNYNYINKDKIVVSSSLIDIYNEVASLFYESDVTYEYNKNISVIPYSLGLALGRRYIDNLIRVENNKCNLINYQTICLCKYDDLQEEGVIEALNVSFKDKINKLIYIVIKDEYDTCKEDFLDICINYDFYVEEENNISKIGSIIEDAKGSKEPTIIFVNLKNKPNKNNNLLIDNTHNKELLEIVNKRVEKELTKWNTNLSQSSSKIKEIISFLENKKIDYKFKGSNIKVNNGYEEKLKDSNNKIFNLFASSPYVLLLTDNESSTMSIKKSPLMSKNNPLGRNILIKRKTNILSYIALALSKLGFKVFLNTNSDNYEKIAKSIKISLQDDIVVNYVIENDSLIYDKTPQILTIKPCDINEVIGVYEILKDYPKATITYVSSDKIKEIKGASYKYVQAGAYPIKKEADALNGVVVSSGAMVTKALEIVKKLESEGIILRLVSMPSLKIFTMQNEKYQKILFPNVNIFFLNNDDLGDNQLYLKNNYYFINNTSNEEIKNKILEILKKSTI